MTDPEITHQEQRAATALANRLRPWATAMQDPDKFAADFIAALRTEGWCPRLGPAQSIPPVGHRDPDTALRGAALVREALAEAARTGEPE